MSAAKYNCFWKSVLFFISLLKFYIFLWLDIWSLRVKMFLLVKSEKERNQFIFNKKEKKCDKFQWLREISGIVAICEQKYILADF